MPYVEHRYGRTFYSVKGRRSTEKLPLVCLHGGPGGHSQFMTELFRLSGERQVYLYDQVGGGKSSKTTKRYWTVPTFVNELKALVDAWGLKRFHLFGASWGTTLALEYYLKRKSGIESIIFQSPLFSTADWRADANRLISRLSAKERKVIQYCHEIDATDSKVYQEAMTEYYARHVCRVKKRRPEFNNDHGVRVYQHMWGASEFSATGSLRNYDRTGELQNVTVPSLLICGQHDEARPRTARGYARLMPNARFEQINDASHTILAEKPGKLIRHIRSFLKEVESRS